MMEVEPEIDAALEVNDAPGTPGNDFSSGGGATFEQVHIRSPEKGLEQSPADTEGKFCPEVISVYFYIQSLFLLPAPAMYFIDLKKQLAVEIKNGSVSIIIFFNIEFTFE